jgi:hypothetical protein
VRGILRKYTLAQSSHLLLQRDGWCSRLFGRAICRLFPSSTFARLLSDAAATEAATTGTAPESALFKATI